MIDEGGAAALGLLADDLARLTLGSDEQESALVGGELAQRISSPPDTSPSSFSRLMMWILLR